MEIIADLETEVKLLIKNTVFNVGDWVKFQGRVDKLIDESVKELENEAMADIIRRTIKQFANNEYSKLIKYLDFGSLPLIVGITGALLELKGMQEFVNEKVSTFPIRKIETGFSNLATSTPKVDNRQPLYNYAEMQERYEKQQTMVQELRAKTNLVICDTHSNCSDRCFKWQGRVYSLDGTYGTTSDGRKYVPLEEATQARDKYGNINGLLGYNCRHKLTEFQDGLRPVVVSKEEQKKQYAINIEQRTYENEIRKHKQRAELSIIPSEQSKYRAKARELTAEYKAFCNKNNVVEYRSRLKI